jgi:hypothetical protein
LGFTVDEIRSMTMPQVSFWLESVAYDIELTVEPMHPTEICSLDDLAKMLPKEKKTT